MKAETFRKIYSHHGMCEWYKAVSLMEDMDLLMNDAEESDSFLVEIGNILSRYKAKRNLVTLN